MAKNKAKAKTKTLKARRAELESQTRDVAQKIWLAGLGAYGRAYTEAATSAKKVNAGTTELFEDLVKRGTEIDSEMKARFTENATVSKATESVTKVTETALRIQRKQREAFEARMQRMRSVLGFKDQSEKTNDIASKIDQLEDEIAELSAKTKTAKGKTKAKVNKDVATRLARLSSEIDAIAKVNAPKKRKTTAKKTAKKTAAKKTTAKKTTASRKAKTKAKA